MPLVVFGESPPSSLIPFRERLAVSPLPTEWMEELAVSLLEVLADSGTQAKIHFVNIHRPDPKRRRMSLMISKIVPNPHYCRHSRRRRRRRRCSCVPRVSSLVPLLPDPTLYPPRQHDNSKIGQSDQFSKVDGAPGLPPRSAKRIMKSGKCRRVRRCQECTSTVHG
jgi:hypothetical protein